VSELGLIKDGLLSNSLADNELFLEVLSSGGELGGEIFRKSGAGLGGAATNMRQEPITNFTFCACFHFISNFKR
jgi:hypothetical protein